MDANSGEPWSEMDISDLTNELAHGRTMAETASFLCRDLDEVRQKGPRKESPAGAGHSAGHQRLTRRSLQHSVPFVGSVPNTTAPLPPLGRPIVA